MEELINAYLQGKDITGVQPDDEYQKAFIDLAKYKKEKETVKLEA